MANINASVWQRDHRLGEELEVPDAPFQITRIREYTAFKDKEGENIWVTFKDGFDNEFHEEIALRYTGGVSWSGIVDAATRDTNKAVHTIKIRFPAPKNVPDGFQFLDTISLSIPINKLEAARLPAKGDTFAFTGALKPVEDPRNPFKPVTE